MLFVAGVGALICGRGLATSFAFAGTCHASDVCLRMLSHSVSTAHREFEPSPDRCAIDVGWSLTFLRYLMIALIVLCGLWPHFLFLSWRMLRYSSCSHSRDILVASLLVILIDVSRFKVPVFKFFDQLA